MVNLTAQRDVEIRRVAAEERYRQTIEAANDAFVGVDADGRVCEWNAAAARMFGWRPRRSSGSPSWSPRSRATGASRYAVGQAEWRGHRQRRRAPARRGGR